MENRMRISTFTALVALATILILAGGCATSGPAYEQSGFHRFVAAISNDYPLRKGIIENSKPYPVEVYIDGKSAGKISQTYFNYFYVTAKEVHTWYVKDLKGNIVQSEKELIVPNAPLGSEYRMLPRRIKSIDTGWIRYI